MFNAAFFIGNWTVKYEDGSTAQVAADSSGAFTVDGGDSYQLEFNEDT